MKLSSRSRIKISIIILVLAVAVLFYNGIHLYFNRFLDSGFLFRFRVPNYIIDQRTGQFSPSSEAYNTFPYSPAFLFIISKILGLSIIDTLYIPLIPIYPLILYIYLSSRLFDNKITIYIISFTVVFFHYGSAVHYQEYGFAEPLYILVSIIIYQYYKYQDKRYILLFVTVYVCTKFWIPDVEVWTLTLLASFFIFTSIIRGHSESLTRAFNIGAIVFILFTSINQKVYSQLIPGLITGRHSLDPLSTFESFVLGLVSSDNTAPEPFIGSGFSPLISTFVEGSYIILSGAFSGIILLWFIYMSTLRNKRYSLESIFCISIFVSFIPWTIINISLGQVPFTVVRFFAPILIIYFIFKTDMFVVFDSYIGLKKVGYILLSIFLILSLSSQVIFYAYNVPQPITDDEVNNKIALWSDNLNNKNVMTDIASVGIINSYIVMNDEREISRLDFVEYNKQRYRYIIGDRSNRAGFNYFIIDSKNIDRDFRGDSSWKYYESLDKYYNRIQLNPNISKIYSSNEYYVYK